MATQHCTTCGTEFDGPDKTPIAGFHHCPGCAEGEALYRAIDPMACKVGTRPPDQIDGSFGGRFPRNSCEAPAAGFHRLVRDPHGYWPTLRADLDPRYAQLADLYDAAQARRGDQRRAFRG